MQQMKQNWDTTFHLSGWQKSQIWKSQTFQSFRELGILMFGCWMYVLVNFIWGQSEIDITITNINTLWLRNLTSRSLSCRYTACNMTKIWEYTFGRWIRFNIITLHKTAKYLTSRVVQWLRIYLSMQGSRVWSLVWEDSTCHRATKPVHYNYRSLHDLKLVLHNKRSLCDAKPMHHN